MVATDAELDGILSGDEGAAAAFRLRAMVDNLLILGANTLGEALDPTPEELFTFEFEDRPNDTRETGGVAIVSELGALVAAGETIDLADEATLRAVVEAAADAVGVTPVGLDAAIAEIAARNAIIKAVPGAGEAARAAIVEQLALDQIDLSNEFVRSDLLFRLVVASRATVDIEGSVAQVATAFAIPDNIDFKQFDAIDALEANDLDGLRIYALGNQINTTLVALQSVTGNPEGDLQALLDAVASAMEGAPVDLTDATTIASLIVASAPDLGGDVVDALADAIAATNEEIQTVVDNANEGDDLSVARNTIAQIQNTSQQVKTDIYTSVANGNRPPEDLPRVLETASAFALETDETTPVVGNITELLEGNLGAAITILTVDDTGAVGAPIVLESGAIVSLDEDGNATYDPNGAFDDLAAGEEGFDAITFDYTVAGSDDVLTATAFVRIDGSDEVPSSDGNEMIVANESDAPIIGNVLANFVDSNANTAPTITVTSTQETPGLVFDETTGDFTFDASDAAFDILRTDEVRTITLDYSINDGDGTTLASTLTAEVTGINDAAEASDDSATVDEDGTVTVDVLGNDSDPENGVLTLLDLDTQNTVGRVTILDGRVLYDTNGAFDDLVAGETATDRFAYTVQDDEGAVSSAIATVTIIGADAPLVTVELFDARTDTAIRTLEDGDTVGLSELGNSRLTIVASVEDSSPIAGDDESIRFDLNNGTFRKLENFVPYALFGDFGGNLVGIRNLLELGENTLSLDIFEKNFGRGDLLGEVDLFFTLVDDSPLVLDDVISVNSSEVAGDIDANVLENDTSVNGEALAVADVVLGQLGEPVAGDNGGFFTIREDGSVDFDAADQFAFLADGETAQTSVDILVAYAGGVLPVTSTITAAVTGENDAPVALDDNVSVDGVTTFDVLANDTDSDGEMLTVVGFTQPQGGTLNDLGGGKFEFVPDGGKLAEPTSFSYTLSDGTLTDTATVELTPTREAPIEVSLFDARGRDTFLRTIEDGDIVYASDLEGAKRLTLTAAVKEDSAIFELEESMFLEFNDHFSRVENFDPYALFGDRGGNLLGQRHLLQAGENTLDISVYSENNARGDVLADVEITFTFVDDL